MAYYEGERRNIINLITDVIDQMAGLFQTEIRLVRAEINQKVSRIANGGVLIGIGSIAGAAALFLLLQAIVTWLAVAGLPEQWGYLIVGLVIAAIAAFCLIAGINNIRRTNLSPDRTIEQIRADFVTLKEHVR